MIYFVTGIDTNTGKTYVTGLIAKYLLTQKKSVITQKLVQTGNHAEDISEDILKHRDLMGRGLFAEDIAKTTCNQIFELPSSPHLASKLENREIDFEAIAESTKILSDRYEYVIIEGAGGLMVPLTKSKLTIDFIKDNHYPVILVSSSKLGSLNHTILSIESLKNRNIPIQMVVYNAFTSSEIQIEKDSFEMIRYYLDQYGYKDTLLIKIPNIDHQSCAFDAAILEGLV